MGMSGCVRKLNHNTWKSMMDKQDFAIFILSHRRPDNIKTLNTLKKSGYTGSIYIIVDDEDTTIDKYYKNYGKDMVKVFNKKAVADTTDEGNNFDERRTITHARNASFEIAKHLGLTYFMQLDDNYVSFEHRYLSKCKTKLMVKKITDLDYVIRCFLEFYQATSFKSIAFAQGGDFIGGAENPLVQRMPMARKCMNSFICSTERPFRFVGTFNEDVCTYVTLGNKGELFGTIPVVSLVQTTTQSQESGLTDIYKKYGTYCKAFSSVMMHPSGVKVSMLNSNSPRLHHSISWNNTAPMIISADNSKKHKGR